MSDAVEGVAHRRVPPPLAPDQATDPYDGLPVNAERPMMHAPSEECRFVVPHPRELCRLVYPVSATHPTRADDLTEKPAALAQPDEPAPWDT